MKNKLNFSTLLENNTFLMALSLLAAVLVWYGVVVRDKEAVATVRNVPVTVDFENSALARLDLQAVNQRNFSVDVDIMGSRTIVGSVKAEDIKIVARLSNVNGPGTFDLSLEGYDVKGKGFVVNTTTPETVSMRFDNFVDLTIPIKLELVKLDIPDGYVLNQEFVYPHEVKVTGPATEMASVTSAKVVVNFEKPLAQTATYDEEIKLYSKGGEELSTTNLSLSDTKATVTLPVLKKKIVPVKIGLINAPTGFDSELLSYQIDPELIELAGPVATINNMTELHLGYIDLKTLEPDTSLYYSVALPPNYISVENIQNINVKFDGKGYGERLLNLSDIRLINNPTDYNVSVQTKTIYGVTIYGPQEQLDKLTGKDLIAQIDMADVEIKTGTITVPVAILIPGGDGCWAYGDSYTAVITVKEK